VILRTTITFFVILGTKFLVLVIMWIELMDYLMGLLEEEGSYFDRGRRKGEGVKKLLGTHF